MKIGFLADLHLSVSDNLSHLDSDTGLSIRTLDRLEALRIALQTSVNSGCEAFILGGDIYDKLNPPERLKHALYQILAPFFGKIEIIIIPGNHDGARFTHNYLTEKIIFNDDFHPVVIVDEPMIYYIGDGRNKVLLLPWTDKITDYDEIINNSEKGLIAFGHLEIKGAKASTEYTLTSGLAPKTFEKFKKVFLGHYHRYQKIRNIYYVGSPLVKDFSELGVEKGFIIYDSILDSIEFIQLEPRSFFQFEISTDTLESVDSFLEKNPPPLGSLFKLVIDGDKNWIRDVLPIIKDIFNSYKPLKLIIVKKFSHTEHNNDSNQLLELSSRIDRIKEVAKEQSEEFTTYGIRIFREAENQYFEVST